VYVEKPCSHNPKEGEMMVQAAEKYRRKVQMGNQRRSWPKIQEAIQFLREGGIGKTYLAECWYTNKRGSIGKGQSASPPKHLNYDLWQGPAPRTPFRSNYLHYNWHWFWRWGNGELGNNGVHFVDVCRWGLGVSYPTLVNSIGGRFRFDDDQETPDTQTVSYDFGSCMMVWHAMSCNQFPSGKPPADMLFHGEKGSVAIRGGGYTVYDPAGKQIRNVTGPGGNREHIENFLAGCRDSASLNSPITEGHISTLLCHVGNISHRIRESVTTDRATGVLTNNDHALAQYWSREYEPGWEPKIS
jgi:predicted dehydrogenase